ncbi:MAG: DUF2934 domain-containing protein [Candidatus Omnitrophota bacterium]
MARAVSAKAVVKKEAPKDKSSCCCSGDRAEIEKLAYKYFLERGGAHGYHIQDWAKAEAIVSKRKKS